MTENSITNLTDDTKAYEYGAYDQSQVSVLNIYLQIIRRRCWVVIAVAVAGATLGAINTFRKPDYYQVESRVLVESHSPRLLRRDIDSQDSWGWDPGFYRTQAELIRSREVLEIALENEQLASMFVSRTVVAPVTTDASSPSRSILQGFRRTMLATLGGEPAPPPQPWERLRGYIEARHIPESHFIRIRIGSTDPGRIVLIANAVADAFVQYHLERKSDALGEVFVFLQNEKEKEEEALLQAQTELQNFRESIRGLSTGLSESEQPAAVRLAQLNDELTRVQIRINQLDAQIRTMRQVLRDRSELQAADDRRLFSLPIIREDAELNKLRQRLADAQKRLASLKDVYGPEHPQLVSARSDQNLLWREFQNALNEIILSQINRFNMLKMEEEQLKAQYDEQHRESLAVARESFSLARLQNEVDRRQRLLDDLISRLLEIDMSAGFVRTNVRVLDRASQAGRPVGPDRRRDIILALFMSVFAGVGLAFVLEHFDDTVKTPEDLKERLRVPLLGFVPYMDSETGKKSGSAELERASIVVREPKSSVAEAYRNIRTSICFSHLTRDKKALAFVSCRPQEGKTTTACNVALVMAESGRKVLLIDADCHRPSVGKSLGLTPQPGLTDILEGKAVWNDTLQQVTINDRLGENLDVITSGSMRPNPGELLGSSAMVELMNLVKSHYDFVLVDAPPVMFVSDSALLGALADGVVFVVRSGSSNRLLLQRAREQLNHVNVKMVGAILNSMIVSRFGRNYSDYYYHGYSHYARDYKAEYYRQPESSDTGKDIQRAAPGRLKRHMDEDRRDLIERINKLTKGRNNVDNGKA